MIIEVDLPDGQAWALAEFLKRAGYRDYRELAADDQEAWAMLEAGERLRAALADKGMAPR
jgi:hypothetical protein